MLTREEFQRRLEAARREENRVGILWLIVFFAAIVAQIPLYMWLVKPEGSPWWAIAQIIEIVVLIAGNVWLVVWYFKNRARRFGLLCPGCNGALHGFAGQVVAQSGNCPACRTAVWME